MVLINIRCPCGREFTTNETFLGTWLRCPNCGHMTLITWPKRRERFERPDGDIPEDEPLFETAPSPEALEEIAHLADDRPRGKLATGVCATCGRPVKRGWIDVSLVALGLSREGRGTRGRSGARLCRRCRSAQRAAAKSTEDQEVRGAAAPPTAPKRWPLALKIGIANLISCAVVVHTGGIAIEGNRPISAAIALLAAVVPIVTVQALVILVLGRCARVKGIALGPAANAAIIALLVQVALAVPAYFSVLLALSAKAESAVETVAIISTALLWLAGVAAVGRVLQARPLHAILLGTAAAFALALCGLALEPTAGVLLRSLPRHLIPTPSTQPAESRPGEAPTDGGQPDRELLDDGTASSETLKGPPCATRFSPCLPGATRNNGRHVGHAGRSFARGLRVETVLLLVGRAGAVRCRGPAVPRADEGGSQPGAWLA